MVVEMLIMSYWTFLDNLRCNVKINGERLIFYITRVEYNIFVTEEKYTEENNIYV